MNAWNERLQRARGKKLLSPEPLNQPYGKNECVNIVNDSSRNKQTMFSPPKATFRFPLIATWPVNLFCWWHHFLSFLASSVLLATMNPCCHDMTAHKYKWILLKYMLRSSRVSFLELILMVLKGCGGTSCRGSGHNLVNDMGLFLRLISEQHHREILSVQFC